MIMKNWNGFFNLESLSEKELKSLFSEALELSDDAYVDILDCSKSFKRQRYPELTPTEYIDKYLSSNTHNVVIDRKAYYAKGHKEGEIGSSTLKSPSLSLYIFLSLDNLYKLVDKYNLPKQLL